MASHDEVAQDWAAQKRKNRSGHHMFFEGRTIYSYGYHFPIATLIEVGEKTVALFTNRDYSNSTARHIGITHHAARGLEKHYVARPDQTVTVADFDESVEVAEEKVRKAIRAITMRDHRLGEAQKAIDNANWLRITFKLDRERITLQDVLNRFPGRFDRKGYEGPEAPRRQDRRTHREGAQFQPAPP